MTLRIETVNGRHLVCGGLIEKKHIRTGQEWAPAGGSNRTVKVTSTKGDWICYTWDESSGRKYHEKDQFSFQCRYCLVVSTPEVPEELM